MNSLPDWNDLPQSLRTKMVEEAETLDPHCGGDCVVQIYLMLREGLQSDEAPQNMTDQQEHLSPEKWPTRDAWIKHNAAIAQAGEPPFQQRVQPWMMACFGPEISADRLERGDRLLEEALELLQSGQYPRDRVAALTDYVYGRPAGEPAQEVGGMMVTLAAYCLAHGLDMHQAGETELARVWTKVEKIRAKQAAKPTGSALPVAAPPAPVGVDAVGISKAAADVLSERRRQVEVERWTPSHDDEHTDGEMAVAAGCYAMGSGAYWPMSWDFEWWKPKTRRQDLVRAGALIIAEIERLDRAALSAAGITDTSASKEAAQDSAPMQLRPISELTLADFGGNVEAFVCELRSRAAEAGVILSDGAAIEAQQKEKP